MEEEEEEEDGEKDEEEEEEEEEYDERRGGGEGNDYDTRSEAGDSRSASSGSFSNDGDSVHSGSASEASGNHGSMSASSKPAEPVSPQTCAFILKGSEKKREKLSSSVRAVRKRIESKKPFLPGVSQSFTPRGSDPSSKLCYILRDARFFLIKSNNHENVSLAKAKVHCPCLLYYLYSCLV